MTMLLAALLLTWSLAARAQEVENVDRRSAFICMDETGGLSEKSLQDLGNAHLDDLCPLGSALYVKITPEARSGSRSGASAKIELKARIAPIRGPDNGAGSKRRVAHPEDGSPDE